MSRNIVFNNKDYCMVSFAIISPGSVSILSQITSPLALMAYGAIAFFSLLGGLSAKQQHPNTRFFAFIAASVFALMLAAGVTMHLIAANLGSEERVAGNVYSKVDGEPVQGALVAIAGSGEAVRTKEDGSFTLTLAGSRKNHTHLMVTHERYIGVEIDLSGPGDHSVIRIEEKRYPHLVKPIMASGEVLLSKSKRVISSISINQDGNISGEIVLKNDTLFSGFDAYLHILFLDQTTNQIGQLDIGPFHIDGKPPGKEIQKSIPISGKVPEAILTNLSGVGLKIQGG